MSLAPLHSDDRVTTSAAFRERFLAEWRRLNPCFGKESNSFWESITVGFRQGLYGYFAPVRLLWWLACHCWRQHPET